MAKAPKKLISVLITSLFLCFLLSYTLTHRIIDDIITPTGNDFEAFFYVFDPNDTDAEIDIDSCIYVGEGTVSEANDIFDDPESLSALITSAPDYSDLIGDNDYIEWNTLYTEDGEIYVIGLLLHDEEPINPDIEIADVFSDIIALKRSNLPEGSYVRTEGYYHAGDGGGATYIISSTTKKADNIFILELKNGLKAELDYDDEINVAQAGIQSGDYISDKFNELIAKAESYGIQTVRFNDGTYTLNKPISLKSLNYIGTGKTKLSVSENFQTGDDKIMYTYPDSLHSVYSLSFENIDFVINVSKSFSQINKEMIFVSLQEIDGCDIINCGFYAYPASTNGAFSKIDLLWFKHSSRIDNVNIDHCIFKNYTGKAYVGSPRDHLVGACIWICGSANTTDLPMNNISITNCEFVSTVSDETIAIWRGHYDQLTIDNCTFANTTQDCDNVIALYKGSFTNTNIDNCKFSLYSGCKFICKVTSLTGDSDVSFDNDTFNLNSGITDTSSRNINVFFTSADDSEGPGLCSANIDVSNCVVNSKNGTKYRSFLSIANTAGKTYNVTESNINTPLSSGLFVLNGSDNEVTVEESNINTSDILSTLDSVEDCRVIINNNTIENKLNNVVRSSADVDYEFTNNTCTSSVYGTQFVGSGLSSNDEIRLKNSNNIFTTNAKLYEYHGGNLKASDIIVKN
ncbi:hypothetical protein NXH64_13515 [Butyrivibrio fibrisolvens]|uniref:hypothetical protein n=1 Tax=Pseudobutyrivibrio ruminis TaxID=46206 RepID=UPI000412EB42|nr:hypothetical protein [Pseudobutyrivibrio ruminis]MDC7280515.1 hypothetical protein [Butyrivibrio fibrisolvens]